MLLFVLGVLAGLLLAGLFALGLGAFLTPPPDTDGPPGPELR